MSYKNKTIFEMTDKEVEEYFNSYEGQNMLENMFNTMENIRNKNRKSEE